MTTQRVKSKRSKERSRLCYRLRARDLHLDLGTQTRIMGIVNITPDSFSQDGCLKHKTNFVSAAVRKARRLIRDGADIIDVGGESTRPGAKQISVKEECARVIPVIQALAAKTTVPVSIDTYKPEVAQKALEAGASIVNNIMGPKINKKFLQVVKNYKAALILMHIRGTPQTMQKKIYYKDLITDVTHSLRKSIEKCLEIGIESDKIIIDPGIGFGKTLAHNLEIINRLKDFDTLGYPLLIGTSRKSFIGTILNRPVSKRLTGTIASVCAAIMNDAHVVRVHDVQPAKEAAMVMDAILNTNKQ